MPMDPVTRGKLLSGGQRLFRFIEARIDAARQLVGDLPPKRP